MMTRIEDRFSIFAKQYRQDRFKFWRLVALNVGSAWKRFWSPFRDWDESHVIATDVEKTLGILANLDECLTTLDSRDQARLAVISLTAKNRAEIMSARSDFYPVYSALVGLCLTVIAIAVPETWVKVVAGGGVLFVVFTSATIRMATREQVAYLKELANVIDHRLKYGASAEDAA